MHASGAPGISQTSRRQTSTSATVGQGRGGRRALPVAAGGQRPRGDAGTRVGHRHSRPRASQLGPETELDRGLQQSMRRRRPLRYRMAVVGHEINDPAPLVARSGRSHSHGYRAQSATLTYRMAFCVTGVGSPRWVADWAGSTQSAWTRPRHQRRRGILGQHAGLPVNDGNRHRSRLDQRAAPRCHSSRQQRRSILRRDPGTPLATRVAGRQPDRLSGGAPAHPLPDCGQLISSRAAFIDLT